MSLDDHVVDQADESSQVVEVGLGESNDAVLEVILHLLEYHGLVLGGLTNLCVFEVLLVAYGARVRHILDQGSQLLAYNLLDLLVVVSLSVLTVLLLVVDKVIDFVVLLAAKDEVGCLYLHIVQDTVDVHESALVVGASLDQLLGQKLTSFGVGAVAHVTLPEAEHLADEVVLKEVH